MTKKQAVKHFGSVSALARAIGVTYEAVRQWGDSIPELRQYQIESVTSGQLKASPKKAA
jgi:DNA-binding transcriptional regulator YdaS (Cro superfamily)